MGSISKKLIDTSFEQTIANLKQANIASYLQNITTVLLQVFPERLVFKDRLVKMAFPVFLVLLA